MMYGNKKLTFTRIRKAVKSILGTIIFKNLFQLWQNLGFHITKNHYYEPIPDTRTLTGEFWQRHSEMIGIKINEKRQLSLLSDFVSMFKAEYDLLPLNRDNISKPYECSINNGSYDSVDSEILYCMIRYFKPRVIFEIGSGHSTYLSAGAILKNIGEGHECDLKAFEPYPNEVLKAGFPGFSQLISKRIQDIPLLHDFRLFWFCDPVKLDKIT